MVRQPDATPRRRDLSRDRLIAAALRLIDGKGVQALSMRALAEAVGVTPMALYNHFVGKRELLAAVADHVVGTAEFDGGHADWRDQIRHCFSTLRGLCLAHPGLPALLEVEGAAPASVFAPLEVTLRALRAAGLDEPDGLRTYYLLVGFTLGQAAYQTRPVASLEPERGRRARIDGHGQAGGGRGEPPAAWDFDASFSYGIELVLKGMEATAGR